MRKPAARLLLLLLLVPLCATLLAPPGAAHAKEGAVQSNPDSFLKLGVGARPFGMGGAFTALADDANACYYNPAGLADAKFWEVNSMRSDSYDFEVLYDMLNLVVPLLPGKAVGFSYYGLGIDDIPITRANVPAIQGFASDKEQAYVLTYGHRISDFMALGFNVKSIRQKVYIAEADGMEADFGLLYTPSRTVRFGLNFQDALPGSILWNTGSEVKIPLTVRGGMAFHLHDWGTLLAVDINKVEDRDAEWNGGFEYQFNDAFQGRFGFNNGDPTAGLTLMRGPFRLDYGFQKADLGDTHRFSTGFRFGSFLLEKWGERRPRRPGTPQCGQFPLKKCAHPKGKGGAPCASCPPAGNDCEPPARVGGTANLMTTGEECDPPVRGGALKPQPDIHKVLAPGRDVVADDARMVDQAPRGPELVKRANKMVLDGKYDEAASLLRDAVAADPTNEDAHLKMAGIHQYQKRYVEAVESYKDAIAVNPANLDNYLNIAALYAKLKDYDKAAEAAAIVTRVAPGTAKAKQAEAMYKNYTGGAPGKDVRKPKTAPARSGGRVVFDESGGVTREPSLKDSKTKKTGTAAVRPAAAPRETATLPDLRVEDMGY